MNEVEEGYKLDISEDQKIAKLKQKDNQVVKAASIGNIAFDTIQDAVNSASDGSTIVIERTIDLTDTVMIPKNAEDTPKNITIDLNGNEITIEDSTKTAFEVRAGSTLTIEDSDEDKSGRIRNTQGQAITGAGTININISQDAIVNGNN